MVESLGLVTLYNVSNYYTSDDGLTLHANQIIEKRERCIFFWGGGGQLFQNPLEIVSCWTILSSRDFMPVLLARIMTK